MSSDSCDDCRLRNLNCVSGSAPKYRCPLNLLRAGRQPGYLRKRLVATLPSLPATTEPPRQRATTSTFDSRMQSVCRNSEWQNRYRFMKYALKALVRGLEHGVMCPDYRDNCKAR